jgi:hypothetical protein
MKSMLALLAGVAMVLAGWTALASSGQALPVGAGVAAASEVGAAASEPESSAIPAATYPAKSPAAAPTGAGKPAAKTPAELAKERAAAEAERKAIAKTQAAVAARRPKAEFENTSVKDVLAYLSDVGKFSIVIDPALAEAGVDLEARTVSLKASALTFESALNLVLPREAGFRVEPGYLLVTTLEKSWLPLKLVAVSVRLHMQEIPDFVGPRFQINSAAQNAATRGAGGGGSLFGAPGAAAPAAAEKPGRMTPKRLIEFVKKYVQNSADRRIATWDDEGGPATIQYMNGQLIITQTDAGLRAAVRILAAIE